MPPKYRCGWLAASGTTAVSRRRALLRRENSLAIEQESGSPAPLRARRKCRMACPVLLCGVLVVELEQSAEAFVTQDRPGGRCKDLLWEVKLKIEDFIGMFSFSSWPLRFSR